MGGGRLNVARVVRAFGLGIFFIFVFSFVVGLDVDFDCPDEIFIGEEFECSVEVFYGDGVYDLKVDLDGERNSVLEIWDDEGDDWLSGYYYLKDFVESGDEVDVRLIISEDGNYDGVLKLRQGSKREFFDFEMSVRENEKVVEEDVEEGVVFHEISEEVVAEKREVIVLNGFGEDEVEEEWELVYESKNGWIEDYLIYGFVLFLGFLVCILVWWK